MYSPTETHGKNNDDQKIHFIVDWPNVDKPLKVVRRAKCVCTVRQKHTGETITIKKFTSLWLSPTSASLWIALMLSPTSASLWNALMLSSTNTAATVVEI